MYIYKIKNICIYLNYTLNTITSDKKLYLRYIIIFIKIIGY